MEKIKVVFLDRDGVVNKERGTYTYKLRDFEFTPFFWKFIKLHHKRGYKFIIITNQGGISKGLYSKKEVDFLTNYIKKAFNDRGYNLLDSFYCPHHDLNENCLCRKPKSLMLERAIHRYNIDKEHSFMIGDSQRDIEAAEKAGIKGVFLHHHE